MNTTKEKNPFIAQTAKDYCLSYTTVEKIYNQDRANMYNLLEDILKENRNKAYPTY